MKVANIPLPAGSSHQNPTKIIIHAIGEIIDTEGEDFMAVEWLRRLNLSVHAFITPSGVVIQSRKYDQGAWHAKAGGHNTNTLGVEFMVPGLHNYGTFLEAIKDEYLTKEAYNAGVELVGEWIARMQGNPEPNQVVIPHSAIDPMKEDPGDGFPMKKFLEDLKC